MTNISELDLQNLRHLIGGYEVSHCKMQGYAEQAQEICPVSHAEQAAVNAVFTVGGTKDVR